MASQLPGLYCQLHSGDNLHSPIQLPNGALVPLGRGPDTMIVTKKCSRKQVSVSQSMGALRTLNGDGLRSMAIHLAHHCFSV